ncbi:MAG: RNA polymerase-binding protein RbpA [Actinomycetes bacterium]
MIQDTSMRGTRLGALSYERDDNVEPAERCIVRYECEKGHATLVPFSVEAEDIPLDWSCRCGRTAQAAHSVPNMAIPEDKTEKHVRSHWDMLMERRTIADLEKLMAERLAEIHAEEPQLARTA